MEGAWKNHTSETDGTCSKSGLIGICATLRTTPTLELNAILYVALVEIAGAWRRRLLLDFAGYMRGSGQGHTEIVHGFDCIPSNLDHCTAESSLDGSFSAHITARDLWAG